ncbi:unnamed protein product [Tilletia controversa]|nr:unnamed protein product [Tilletia controversa]
MAIYEAQVSLHSQLRIRRPQEEQWTDQLPLPFGMDIVAACLNGPELAGPMLHTVGIFFSFLVELAKLCGIRFSAQAVAHGTIADDVLRKSLGKDTIPVRHTAYWTRQEITPVTSAMIIAIELAKYILASTKAPILLHGRRDFVRFYGFIRNNLLASAPCRQSRLWRDISPFQMIDDLFFGAICVSCRADIDPREAQLQALDALERDLANLATRSSYLRREVTTLMNSKAHLEDNLDAVQADLKKAQEELTQHRRATAVLTGMVGLTGRVIPEDIAAAVSKHFEIRAVRAPEGNPTSTDPPADASVRALASTFPERILGERDAEAVIRVVPGFQNKDREPTIPTLALARLFILASDQLLSKKELLALMVLNFPALSTPATVYMLRSRLTRAFKQQPSFYQVQRDDTVENQTFTGDSSLKCGVIPELPLRKVDWWDAHQCANGVAEPDLAAQKQVMLNVSRATDALYGAEAGGDACFAKEGGPSSSQRSNSPDEDEADVSMSAAPLASGSFSSPDNANSPASPANDEGDQGKTESSLRWYMDLPSLQRPPVPHSALEEPEDALQALLTTGRTFRIQERLPASAWSLRTSFPQRRGMVSPPRQVHFYWKQDIMRAADLLNKKHAVFHFGLDEVDSPSYHVKTPNGWQRLNDDTLPPSAQQLFQWICQRHPSRKLSVMSSASDPSDHSAALSRSDLEVDHSYQPEIVLTSPLPESYAQVMASKLHTSNLHKRSFGRSSMGVDSITYRVKQGGDIKTMRVSKGDTVWVAPGPSRQGQAIRATVRDLFLLGRDDEDRRTSGRALLEGYESRLQGRQGRGEQTAWSVYGLRPCSAAGNDVKIDAEEEAEFQRLMRAPISVETVRSPTLSLQEFAAQHKLNIADVESYPSWSPGAVLAMKFEESSEWVGMEDVSESIAVNGTEVWACRVLSAVGLRADQQMVAREFQLGDNIVLVPSTIGAQDESKQEVFYGKIITLNLLKRYPLKSSNYNIQVGPIIHAAYQRLQENGDDYKPDYYGKKPVPIKHRSPWWVENISNVLKRPDAVDLEQGGNVADDTAPSGVASGSSTQAVGSAQSASAPRESQEVEKGTDGPNETEAGSKDVMASARVFPATNDPASNLKIYFSPQAFRRPIK